MKLKGQLRTPIPFIDGKTINFWWHAFPNAHLESSLPHRDSYSLSIKGLPKKGRNSTDKIILLNVL